MTELRSLSEFCNLGEMLEDMIQDRLVCGINDEAMQKRMLAEPNLTYKRAVELVDKDVICHNCKKPGHLPRACSIQPNKLLSRPKKSSSLPSSSFRKNKSRSVHQVKEEKCDEEQLLHLFSVRSQEHTKELP